MLMCMWMRLWVYDSVFFNHDDDDNHDDNDLDAYNDKDYLPASRWWLPRDS